MGAETRGAMVDEAGELAIVESSCDAIDFHADANRYKEKE
jgi:hypothetical protein